LGDLRRHNVAIVAVGDGDESVRVANASAHERFHIGAIADHRCYVQAVWQATKRIRLLVNHRHIIAIYVEYSGKLGAYATAAYNDHVHFFILGTPVMSRAYHYAGDCAALTIDVANAVLFARAPVWRSSSIHYAMKHVKRHSRWYISHDKTRHYPRAALKGRSTATMA
jgi:hypothetical protein